jgi:hypothetical protein
MPRRGAHSSLVTSLISGYELWKIDNDGLIAESKGHFDADNYAHQALRRHELTELFCPRNRRIAQKDTKAAEPKEQHESREVLSTTSASQ